MSLLPFEAAHRLAQQAPEHRWLLDGLWSDQAVGILGGEPKCCKSFLALDVAVAVASGTSCLGAYRATRRGRVLLYAAEDALHMVRQRLEGLCALRGLVLADLDLQVITAPTVRLDLPADRQRIDETIAHLRPTLLVLDPFVRLHRIDENVSGEVAPLLAFLRDLQRRYQTAILIVHHAKKGGGRLRDGQALRGTSEFHAWGDSNLYLRRRGEDLLLTVEHRAAPSLGPLHLRLAVRDEHAALVVATPAPEPTGEPTRDPIPADLVRDALEHAGGPLRRDELRAACRLRTATFADALRTLSREGVVRKTAGGYVLAACGKVVDR